VVAFGHKTTARRLFDALAECDLGAAPRLRVRDGEPVRTDNGGAGVVEHGLFLDLADEGLLGIEGDRADRILP
jgi:ribose 5-phosphate isomerase A